MSALTIEIAVTEIPHRPVDTVYFASRHTVEHREVFIAIVHPAFFVAHNIAGSRFQGHLGLTVSVEVVTNKRRIPYAGLYALTQVERPEKSAIAQVSFDLIGSSRQIARHTGINIGIGCTDNVIVNAVAIEVGQSHLARPDAVSQFNTSIGKGR